MATIASVPYDVVVHDLSFPGELGEKNGRASIQILLVDQTLSKGVTRVVT